MNKIIIDGIEAELEDCSSPSVSIDEETQLFYPSGEITYHPIKIKYQFDQNEDMNKLFFDYQREVIKGAEKKDATLEIYGETWILKDILPIETEFDFEKNESKMTLSCKSFYCDSLKTT